MALSFLFGLRAMFRKKCLLFYKESFIDQACPVNMAGLLMNLGSINGPYTRQKNNLANIQPSSLQLVSNPCALPGNYASCQNKRMM